MGVFMAKQIHSYQQETLHSKMLFFRFVAVVLWVFFSARSLEEMTKGSARKKNQSLKLPLMTRMGNLCLSISF